MIDIRKLKELVRLMVANDLTELDLRDSEEQVMLRRQHPGGTAPMVAPVMAHAALAAPPSTAPATPEATAPPPTADGATASNLSHVESPMVGTFYSAADPDSPAFVKVGDRVDPDTVVCLIEAMKIFNEIKAEQSGIIEKVMVKNSEAVEFGQPLFAILPD